MFFIEREWIISLNNGRKVKNRIELESKLDSLSVLEEWIEGITRTYCMEDERAADILVAVTEAFTNAVVHGKDESNSVVISAVILENEIAIGVRQACESCIPDIFTTTKLPYDLESPDGRGLYIMSQLSKRIDVSEDKKEILLYFELQTK